MIRSAPLPRLPAGLEFPPALANKIAFDPQTHELRFCGFMSKGDFDALSQLSNDLDYLKALERLFQICEFTDRESPPLSFPFAWGIALSAVAAGIAGLAVWLLIAQS